MKSFYNLTVVRDAMESSLDSGFYYANTSPDSLERIAEKSLKAKAGLNKALFGDANTFHRVISCKPSRARLRDVFRCPLLGIGKALELVGLPFDEEGVINNRLPDGSKLSRTLLRKLGDDKKLPVSNLTGFNLSTIRVSLPNLPREDATFEVFIQNFYSSLASFRANIVVTTAFADILTASEFCSFSSCYKFDGAFASSTIVRALDSQTAMVFLVNSNSETKLGRFWMTFSPNARRMVQFPVYGEGMSEGNVKRAIGNVCKMISENQQIENAWERAEYDDYHFDDLHNSRAYIDTPKRMLTHKTEGAWGFSVNWPRPLCVHCGDSHFEKTLLCSDCQDTRPTCAECGERTHEDNAFYDEENDQTLCQSCYEELFVSCDQCGESIRIDSEGHHTIADGDYCEKCYYDVAVECHECGEIVHNDETTYVESVDGSVCNSCLRDHYNTCDQCGEYFSNDDLHRRANEDYCEACLAEAWEDNEATFFDEIVHYDMFVDSIFYTLQAKEFPKATPAVVKPELDDYILLAWEYCIGNALLMEYAKKQMPLKVVHLYRTQNPMDNDVQVFIPGRSRGYIITSQQIARIVSKETAQAFTAHNDAFDAMFGQEEQRKLEGYEFTCARWNAYSVYNIQAGTRIVLKPFDELTYVYKDNIPNTMSEMRSYFDGETVLTVSYIYESTTYDVCFISNGWIFSAKWVKRVLKDSEQTPFPCMFKDEGQRQLEAMLFPRASFSVFDPRFPQGLANGMFVTLKPYASLTDLEKDTGPYIGRHMRQYLDGQTPIRIEHLDGPNFLNDGWYYSTLWIQSIINEEYRAA